MQSIKGSGSGWSERDAGSAIQWLMISFSGSQSRSDILGLSKDKRVLVPLPGSLIQWFWMSPGQIEIRKSFANEADSYPWLRAAKLSLGQVYISFLPLLSASV